MPFTISLERNGRGELSPCSPIISHADERHLDRLLQACGNNGVQKLLTFSSGCGLMILMIAQLCLKSSKSWNALPFEISGALKRSQIFYSIIVGLEADAANEDPPGCIRDDCLFSVIGSPYTIIFVIITCPQLISRIVTYRSNPNSCLMCNREAFRCLDMQYACHMSEKTVQDVKLYPGLIRFQVCYKDIYRVEHLLPDSVMPAVVSSSNLNIMILHTQTSA